MEFRTIVDIPKLSVEIRPCEELLFVGSCFADEVGQRFREEGFPVTVNPYGTMYNPVSILHTLQRYDQPIPRVVFLTLGTNHVYRLKSSGQIVDNCEKRPQALFQEEQLTVDECCDCLCQTADLLTSRRPDVQVVVTVSPIRYRKYGYHGSQVSKATLLLAIDRLMQHTFLFPLPSSLSYFPAYEIIMDELRDYRFYKSDMLHPSGQAVDYIWERIVESCLSEQARQWLKEWLPLKRILAHKPFHAESEEYRALMDKTMLKVDELRKKYTTFAP